MGKGRSDDEMTVTTHESWIERMCNSIFGSIFGFFLMVAGLCLCWWNEHQYVDSMLIIEGSEHYVKEAGCAATAPTSLDHELIHASCNITNIPTLTATGPDSTTST